MAIVQDWKIRTTRAQCERTGNAFEDGEHFFTCIFEDPESDGFIRRDYSVASWAEVKDQLDPAPFSFWRSTYQAPPPPEEEPHMNDSSAEGMLRRLIEEDDPRTENARYILALMLERKKTLIPVDVKDTETRRLLFYEHKDNADVFIVADPQLRLDEIEAVQKEVAELLAREEAGPGARSPEGGVSEGGGETAEEVGGTDGEKPEQDGEKSEKAEDEPVAPAGEGLS